MLTLSNKTLLKLGSIAFLTATTGTGIYFLASNNSTKPILDNIQIEETSINPIEEKLPEKLVVEEPTKEVPQKTKATDLLKKDKRKLLNGDNDKSIWDENWKNFKKKYKEAKAVGSSWTFAGLETALQYYNVALPGFKERCEENSKIEMDGENDPIYIDLKDFCTKDDETL